MSSPSFAHISSYFNFFLIIGLTLSIFCKSLAIFCFTFIISILVNWDLVTWLGYWSPKRENIIFSKAQQLQSINSIREMGLSNLVQDPDWVILFADLLPFRDTDPLSFDKLMFQVNDYVSSKDDSTSNPEIVYASFDTWTEHVCSMSKADKRRIRHRLRKIIECG